MTLFLRDTPGRTCLHREDFVSIGIVSFNRHEKLNRLIDSIHKYADMPFELVISDDGGKLYDDYNFIKSIKDRVSHISLNLGRNKGLHVNANNAISMTRSKHVCLFYDDNEVVAPFMRESASLLSSTPYVGVIYLGDNEGTFGKEGVINCRNSLGQEYSLMCKHGGSWATAFRKDYWYEVGGYSEDDAYGDLPFINKGWARGYFSCILKGSRRSQDTDKTEDGRSKGEHTGRFIDGTYQNYPKIFRISDQVLKSMDQERSSQCSLRNHNGRSEEFNEFDQHGWDRYIKVVTSGPEVDWQLLESKFHGRFIEQLKKDALPLI